MAVMNNCRVDDCRQRELNAEITRLQAEISKAHDVLCLEPDECDLVTACRHAIENMLESEREMKRFASQLDDARELLREAIPHLVGNGHWDGVDRIRAHLALAEAEKPTTIVKVSSPPR
jgi:hypothetical protein